VRLAVVCPRGDLCLGRVFQIQYPQFVLPAIPALCGLVAFVWIRLARAYRASDKKARRYARVALIKEQPQEYPNINQAALEWGRFRVILWGVLAIYFLSALIAHTRGLPILSIALSLFLVVMFALALKHYTLFRRQLLVPSLGAPSRPEDSEHTPREG
jgi:hypothetical protein